MNRLTLYITPTLSSVSVSCGGAERQTSARSTTEMLAAMPAEDLAALVGFARALLSEVTTRKVSA